MLPQRRVRMQGVLLAATMCSEYGGSPMICLVLTGKTIEENLEQFRRNRPYISLLELRVDLLAPENREKAVDFPYQVDLPVILTCRRKSDGGMYGESERHRFSLMEELAKGFFSYIDLEDDVKQIGRAHV